jgi:invasion protein IalB
MKNLRASIAGAIALSLLAFGASAQTAPAGGGAPLTPSETKPFGDWTVRCYPVKSPSPCDMFELLANKTTQQRVLSVSIAYLPGNDKHVIQIAVPLGIMIQKGLVLESDAYTSPMLHYRRCDRGGCYVEMLLDNQAVTALASATTGAKVKIVAEGGKVFEIPFSLNGYADAHGAMQDLARKHVATATPAAPAPETPAPAAPAPTPDATPTPDTTPSPTP